MPDSTPIPTLQPLAGFDAGARRLVHTVLTDLDDTLTREGRLEAQAYAALERLEAAGLRPVVVTGRPAGWCDHIARMWPVAGVIGENGACWFRYDRRQRRMLRHFWKDAVARAEDRLRLNRVAEDILAQVPGCAVSADQDWRLADLAIDFQEDVPPLPPEAIQRIVQIFEQHGAQAKVSSIHVNGWFGDYDKLAMTRRFFREVWGQDLEVERTRIVFSGDSPNDAPMFAFFPNAVGVANVLRFRADLPAAPRWVTRGEGGAGFAELAEALLAVRQGASKGAALPAGSA